MNKNIWIVFLLIAAVIVAGAWFMSNETSEIPALSQQEAHQVAMDTKECSMAGILTDQIVYNEITKTWWFDLERMPELEKDGCNPACVVSEETKTAEVNWRCTGLLIPQES